MKEWEKSARVLTWKLGQIIFTNKKKYSDIQRKPFFYCPFGLTKVLVLMASFEPSHDTYVIAFHLSEKA